MPHKAGRNCTTLGCAGIVQAGRCSVCGPTGRGAQREYDQRRGSAAARGYDRRWQKIRLMHLRANPLCVMCLAEGRTTLATDVDHIVPRRQGGTDAPSNLQSLCHSHHSQKTAGEGGANPYSLAPGDRRRG